MSPTHPPARQKVLIVEDEETLAAMIAAYLERGGFQTFVVHNGPDGVQAVHDRAPDVVILDLGLPGLDGIEVCRRIRTFTDCYVIVVTARSDEVDTLIGLAVGADDYLTKPFSVRELVARVQAVLRRPRSTGGQAPRSRAWEFGDLRVDADAQRVHLTGVEVALTPTERDLLMTLARRPSMAFSRRQLIAEIWGPDWGGDEHLVDVHVAHLRRKLGDDPETGRYVTTVRGVGYRMGQG
ncbi:response regulator transcription factor [Granulicoccus phenolivorans]|uniref:response regulator transcription factor n=1 Tax=Granulicoccus phenolivorans TaxID=266854 RepID=UPI0003FA8B2C|nr:response regulator transcription factor [Granulicoccus phenolivorans]